MASGTMEYVMENKGELEELEDVTEIDAALLRDLLEELESEENIVDTKENNCLIQSAVVDESTSTESANYDVFDIEQPHEFGWLGMMESASSPSLPRQSDDMAVPDWFAATDDVVGTVQLGFEYYNNIGDYSYLYNETTYCRLWEEES
ncbi:hypothetical protein PanWU01x14_360400 [Parasponia andersonii]|uniref:Uncharacterized protein n=1 Tax=Parasponia andersonii TaxID=3476 RepID=A0A2P5A7N0_PARAD|nr:hypothetical protein PanWU01x14_360400 [Parasponia andersonii]